MKAYRDIIRTYVNSRGLDSHYQPKHRLLYVLLGKGDIDLFCLFNFENGAVMSWSLLPWQVPKARKDRVERLLNSLNANLGEGMFYIDRETACVAFSRFYFASGQAVPDKDALEAFCAQVLDVMPRYHRVIWEEAFSQEEETTGKPAG